MLFRGKHDLEYLKKLNRELIENVLSEKVTYYGISKKFSTKNLYGEAKDKIFDPPVEVYGLVRWADQDVTTTNFGQDIKYNLGVHFLSDTLTEKNLRPTEGDMIEYDDKQFEITSIVYPKQMLGKESESFYIKLECTTVRENVFRAYVSGTPEEPLRTRPDETLSSSFRYSDVMFPYTGSY